MLSISDLNFHQIIFNTYLEREALLTISKLLDPERENFSKFYKDRSNTKKKTNITAH